MAKTNLGKVALTPKGTYSATATYEILDFVYTTDSSYVSLQSNNVGHPVSDPLWWQPLATGSQASDAAEEAQKAAEAALEAAAAAAPVVVNVEGTEVTINVEGNHKYICGELVSLKIGTVEKSARTSAIFFSSGATATELTWSNDLVEIVGYKTPVANKAYEINIEELRAIIE